MICASLEHMWICLIICFLQKQFAFATYNAFRPLQINPILFLLSFVIPASFAECKYRAVHLQMIYREF